MVRVLKGRRNKQQQPTSQHTPPAGISTLLAALYRSTATAPAGPPLTAPAGRETGSRDHRKSKAEGAQKRSSSRNRSSSVMSHELYLSQGKTVMYPSTHPSNHPPIYCPSFSLTHLLAKKITHSLTDSLIYSIMHSHTLPPSLPPTSPRSLTAPTMRMAFPLPACFSSGVLALGQGSGQWAGRQRKKGRKKERKKKERSKKES